LDKNIVSIVAVILAFVIFAPMITERSFTGKAIQDSAKYCGAECPNGYVVASDYPCQASSCDGSRTPLCKKESKSIFGFFGAFISPKIQGQCTTAGQYGACYNDVECNTFECGDLDFKMVCLEKNGIDFGYCSCVPKDSLSNEPVQKTPRTQNLPNNRVPQFKPLN